MTSDRLPTRPVSAQREPDQERDGEARDVSDDVGRLDVAVHETLAQLHRHAEPDHK